MPWSLDPHAFSVMPQRQTTRSSRGLAWERPAPSSRQASQHKIGSLGLVGSTERITVLKGMRGCWVFASVGGGFLGVRPTRAGPIGSLGVPLKEACAR